jgi:hypothetical protein
MFANVLHLELRKQRKDFLIIVGFAAIVMVCFLVEAILKNRNLIEFVKDLFGFLSIGFVFVLAISGASSAYHLRREPYKSADELLPFKPAQRTVGSYFVNLLYLLIGSSVFMLATYFFGASKEIDWLKPSLAIFLIIHFHMLCFIFAYWMNHSALAIVFSALIIWCEFLLIEQRSFFFLFLKNPYVSSVEAFLSVGSVLSFIVGFVGGLIALALISTRIERERNVRWSLGFIAFCIVITGTLLLTVDLIKTSYSAQTKLWTEDRIWWIDEYLSTTQISRKAAVLTTNTGSIVYVDSDQRKLLRKVPVKLFSKPNQFDVITMNENKGEIWAIIRNDEAKEKDYAIWKSISGESLKLHSTFNSKGLWPIYLVKCKDQVCVYGHTSEKLGFATIGEKGLNEWQFIDYHNSFLGAIRNHLFQDEIRNGAVAVLSGDNTYLTRNRIDGTIQKWPLTGKADIPSFFGSILTSAFHKNGEPYFVIPVMNNGKYSLVVCNPDGSVVEFWNKDWTANERLTWERVPNGGSGWVVRDAKSWKPIEAIVVSENGQTFPSFPVYTPSEDDSNFVDFVRKENSSLWVLTADHLSKIDLLTGRKLNDFKIEADRSDWSDKISRTRTEEGIYFVKDDRIGLIDWNGKIKDLGSATLN